MKLSLRTFFVAFLVAISLLNGYSQTTGKKKFVKPESTQPKPDESKTPDSEAPVTKAAPAKVEKEPSKWGFGVNLGNIGFANNAINIGLDPNIAYRLQDAFAVGFMMKMNYYNAKYAISPTQNLTYTAFDFGPTVFARYKPLLKMEGSTPFMQGIFVQGEFERSYVSRESIDEFGNLILNDDGTKIETEVTAEHYLYVGAGLSSGYPFSSFFSLHYNLLDSPELSRLPLTYRIGFTWNY